MFSFPSRWTSGAGLVDIFDSKSPAIMEAVSPILKKAMDVGCSRIMSGSVLRQLEGGWSPTSLRGSPRKCSHSINNSCFVLRGLYVVEHVEYHTQICQVRLRVPARVHATNIELESLAYHAQILEKDGRCHDFTRRPLLEVRISCPRPTQSLLLLNKSPSALATVVPSKV